MTRRSVILSITVLIVLVAMLVLASAASAQDATRLVCYVAGDNVLPGDVTIRSVIHMGDTVFYDNTYTPGSTDDWAARSLVLVPVGATETLYHNNIFTENWLVATDILNPNGDCLPALRDGRVNDGGDQLGAPLAAYCRNGGMEVWDISDTGQGTLGFTVTADEIAAGIASATSSGQSVLIGSGLGNSLYAGAQGQLVLTGPDMKEWSKTYTYAAPGNVCQSA